VQILKQPQYQPLPLEKQVVILYAGTRGYIDAFPVDVVEKYEAGLYRFIEERHPDIYAEIAEKKIITEELDAKLANALKAYNDEFKDTIKS